MTTYICTIEFRNENFELEYSTIFGVFANEQTAKTELAKRAKLQRDMWKDSFFKRLGKAKVALLEPKSHISKIYTITKAEVQ